MASYLVHLPSYVLSTEFLLGGIVRLSPFPFREAHTDVIEKNTTIAPLLYPLIPFRDVHSHNAYVGTWMLVTGAVWGLKRTRGSLGTLGLSLFWSSILLYSQVKAGMDLILPSVNLGLGLIAWWLENKADGRR